MKVVGLTGGIATGKSTVSRYLIDAGYPVIDADVIAREVVEPGKPAFVDIVARFGSFLVNAEGELDRRKLGALVFSDLARLEELNEIVHPRVRHRVEELLEAYRREGVKVVFFDCPLLYESYMEEMVDEVWVVYADARAQMERMIARDHFSKAEAEMRIRAQMGIEAKRERADVVLDNTGILDDLGQVIDALLLQRGIQ